MFKTTNTILLLQVCAVILAVMIYNGQRNRSKLTRSAILLPSLSPWTHIYANADPSSFLTLTGFNRESFELLYHILFDDFPEKDTSIGGRPSLMDNKSKLGLYLFYVNSTMKLNHLCLLFGVTPTRCSSIIEDLMEMICDKLLKNKAAKVRFPKTVQEQLKLAKLVRNREPTVSDVIGFTDGLSIPVQCASDSISQAINFNGYHHDTMVNNTFTFGPNGKIIHACINYPGSWHDSSVSQSLIEMVIKFIGNFKLCIDQGFPRSGKLFNKFIGPMSSTTRRKIAPCLRKRLLVKHNKYVSLRQSSEWGMRALQGTFSRLKSRLTSNKEKRRKIILSIVLLHNFRTHYVGLNQIATVFNPLYQQYINIDNYDRIKKYCDNNF